MTKEQQYLTQHRGNSLFYGRETITYLSDDFNSKDYMRHYFNVWAKIRILADEPVEHEGKIYHSTLEDMQKFISPRSASLSEIEWQAQAKKEYSKILNTIQENIDDQLDTVGEYITDTVRNTIDNFPNGIKKAFRTVDGVREEIEPYYYHKSVRNEFLFALLTARSNVEKLLAKLTTGTPPTKDTPEEIPPVETWSKTDKGRYLAMIYEDPAPPVLALSYYERLGMKFSTLKRVIHKYRKDQLVESELNDELAKTAMIEYLKK